LQESKVALEPILAFEALNLLFHEGDIGGELDRGRVVEVNIIVGFAFDQLDAFSIKRGPKVIECFAEEVW